MTSHPAASPRRRGRITIGGATTLGESARGAGPTSGGGGGVVSISNGKISSMSTPTPTPPRELMAHAVKLVSGQKAMQVSLLSPFVAKCEKHGLEFVMEVAATDATQSAFVVRLQMSRGDAGFFKELAARIIPPLGAAA